MDSRRSPLEPFKIMSVEEAVFPLRMETVVVEVDLEEIAMGVTQEEIPMESTFVLRVPSIKASVSQSKAN